MRRLRHAGLSSWDDLEDATDEDLLAIKGIGLAKLKRLREFQESWAEAKPHQEEPAPGPGGFTVRASRGRIWHTAAECCGFPRGPWGGMH